MTQVSQPYAPNGTVYWTTYTYDGLGRPVSVVSPDGASTTTYAYAGNTTTITDPAGKWKKQTVDVFGNLIQVNEPNPAGGADYVTTYTYDLLNHLTQVSMPRPNGTQTRTWVYDPTTQRLTSETHPETGTTSYTYNTDSTLASKTDAKGQVAQYTYDGNQRVTEIQFFTDPTHPTSESTCQRVTITWDVGTNAKGRIGTRQTGITGCPNMPTETFTYTPGGLITDKRLTMPTYHLTATLDGSISTTARAMLRRSPGGFGGMSPPDITAAAIIHELLHAVGAIPSDSTDPSKSAKNSATVKEDCF